MTRTVKVGPDEKNRNNRRIIVNGAQWMKVYGFNQEEVEERARLIAALLSIQPEPREEIPAQIIQPEDNVTILVTKAQREAALNSGKKLNDWIGDILRQAVEDNPSK